jgi:hypothetical protein
MGFTPIDSKHTFWSDEVKLNVNPATFQQKTFQKVERRVPELVCIGTSTGIPGSGQVWHGEEYASAAFVLRKNTRYHPAGEFPRSTTPVPYADLFVTITRYASSSDAQKDLEKSFRLRAVTFEPKVTYKGATLYKYQGASGSVMAAICQSGLYVIEISPNSESASLLTMKVLDVVLAELHSN